MAGQRPPGWADDLIRVTEKLKVKLGEEGISLPTVLFVPSPELPPNVFRITMGVAVDSYDVYKDNYLAVLERKVRDYQIPNLIITRSQEVFFLRLRMRYLQLFLNAVHVWSLHLRERSLVGINMLQ